GGPDDAIRMFGPRWWGILGMIGWAYLICGLIAIAAKGRFAIILTAWITFSLLSIAAHAGLVPEFLLFLPSVLRDGTHAGLTMGGVLTTMIFMHYRARKQEWNLTWVLLTCAAVLTV